MEKENITFEEALAKLQNAVNKLENGEIKLDEAFEMFEQGIKYARICEERLTNIEDKVSKILKDGKLEDFKVEE
jgi:exodeoxyribonuclease VII small subunit